MSSSPVSIFLLQFGHHSTMYINVCHPNGEIVHIPNRDARLPRFYLLKTHSKVQLSLWAKRGFLYLQDISSQAMKDYPDYFEGMKFTDGNEKAILEAGEYPEAHQLCVVL